MTGDLVSRYARHGQEVAENSVVTVNGDLHTLRLVLHLAEEHSLFADCTSTQMLQQPQRSLLNCSNKLSIAAAPSASAAPCIASPDFQPMTWHLHNTGFHWPAGLFLNCIYGYAANNSQAQANQSIAGRSTLALKIACANPVHASPLSNHAAISILLAVSLSHPCLPKLPTLHPATPRTAFNPHRDALAAHCKLPYRQCSAHLHRSRPEPACEPLSIRHYGFIAR